MVAAQTGRTIATGQESALQDFVHRLAKSPQARRRRAVHVHLSRLHPSRRREHHIRIASSSFDSILKKYDRQVFVLSNGDLIFVVANASIGDVNEVVEKLQEMFYEDPLVHDAGVDGRSGRFVTWYNLQREFEKFSEMCDQLAQERIRRDRINANSGIDGSPTDNTIRPKELTDAITRLAEIDVLPFIQRQTVCLLAPGEPIRTVFSELYVSMAKLSRQLLPNGEITSNRWLLQFLTEILDARMLHLLANDGVPDLDGPFSININVSSLLSNSFLEFDSALKHRAPGTVILEIQKIDIFSDMASYIFARDFARERGYRVCLDGLSHLTFPFIDRSRLGADLVKVIWSPDMAQKRTDDLKNTLKDLVMRRDPGRVILCRCDSREAIEWGSSLGIHLFQGRIVDSINRAQQSEQTKHAAVG